MPGIQVIVTGDTCLVRDMLCDCLEHTAEIELLECLTYDDNVEAVVRRQQPRVVVMVIDAPEYRCFDVAEELVAIGSVALVFIAERLHDLQIEAALACKASGMLTGGESKDELLEAISKVAAGGRWYSKAVEQRLAMTVGHRTGRRRGVTKLTSLSKREREVLMFIAEGLSKKEIASDMHLSVKTIENHTAKLMNKLEIHDRVALTRYAICEGLVQV